MHTWSYEAQILASVCSRIAQFVVRSIDSLGVHSWQVFVVLWLPALGIRPMIPPLVLALSVTAFLFLFWLGKYIPCTVEFGLLKHFLLR